MSESQEMILYYTLESSFSQKVVLALNYLNLGFESHFIKLFEGEQLEPWFLDINPKGEVPTLRDGELVLTDSVDIIQYLNDTYDTRRSDEKLIPNPVTPLGRSVNEMNQLLCSVRTFVLTFGSAFHPQHTEGSKLSETERQNRTNYTTVMLPRIQSKMESAQPPYKESYTYKFTKLSTGSALLKDESAFIEEIDNTRKVLEKVEEQLGRSDGKWMFSDHFTVADITLSVLLFRINKLGLAHKFWTSGNLPKVASYLERVLQAPFAAKSLC